MALAENSFMKTLKLASKTQTFITMLREIVFEKMFSRQLYKFLYFLLLIFSFCIWGIFIGFDNIYFKQYISLISLSTGLVSLFAFIIPGRWLYNRGFYKWLYHFSGDYQSFKSAKWIIWLTLILITAFVSWFVANFSFNIWHNLTALLQICVFILALSLLLQILIVSLIEFKWQKSG